MPWSKDDETRGNLTENEALALLTKSAELGYAKSEYELSCYYKVWKADNHKAKYWLDKALAQGWPLEEHFIGCSYTTRRELELFHKANAGDIDAMYRYAQHLMSHDYCGGYIEEDLESWMLKAAELQHKDAQNMAGDWFYRKQDHEKAKYWYTCAAKQGCEHSSRRLEEINNKYNLEDKNNTTNKEK